MLIQTEKKGRAMAFLRAGSKLEKKKRNFDDLNAEHAPNARERLFPDREDGKR